MKSRVPLFFAIVLLLLPVLYVGSYLALVLPGGRLPVADESFGGIVYGMRCHYRVDGNWASFTFWPLEQIDRKLRPMQWDDSP